MASYTTSLRLVLPATGEYPGTWGTQTNNGLTNLVDTSIAGTATITMTAADYTLSTANGASDEARAAILNVTGTPGAARNIIVPAVSKIYVVYNNTTGGFAQTVKTSAGTGISVPNGSAAYLRCDGTNVVEAVNYFGSLTVGTVTGGTFVSPSLTGTPTAPTAAGGTSTTQIATTAFVATNFASLNSPAFTGTPTVPTAAPGTNTTQAASTAFVATSFAPLASPAFTGVPTAPTASAGVSTTQVATTAFVTATAFSSVLPGQTGNAGKYVTTDGTNASWANTGFDQALALLGNTRNNYYAATDTFTVPAGITTIRAYAFGAGGAGANSATNQSGGGGGGGGCAYGDIAVTPGQTVNITISGSSTTVAIGGTTYLTGNAGNAASGTTGGTGGTATKHASVTNGFAVVGQGGAAGDTGGANIQVSGGGGGASGSPTLQPVATNAGTGGAAIATNVAVRGGGGGGWGGSGAIYQETTASLSLPSFGGGVGSGSDSVWRAGSSSSTPGEGLGLQQLFSDPLLRPLTGVGGTASITEVSESFSSPPGLGGGGVATVRSSPLGSGLRVFRGSFGGGGAGGAASGTDTISAATSSIFGGGGGGGAARITNARDGAAGGVGGGGGGGAGYSGSAGTGANGGAGGGGAVFILY